MKEVSSNLSCEPEARPIESILVLGKEEPAAYEATNDNTNPDQRQLIFYPAHNKDQATCTGLNLPNQIPMCASTQSNLSLMLHRESNGRWLRTSKADHTNISIQISDSRCRPKKDYQLGMVPRKFLNLDIHPKERLAIQLHRLGFGEDEIEVVIFATAVTHVEDALDYLIKNKEQLWDHTFVHHADVLQGFQQDYCLKCQQDIKLNRLKEVTGPSVSPRDAQKIQFVKNGLAMKNLRCQQALKHKPNRSWLDNTLDVSHSTAGLTLALGAAGSTRPNTVQRLPAAEPTLEEHEPCYVCGDSIEFHSRDYNLLCYESSGVPGHSAITPLQFKTINQNQGITRDNNSSGLESSAAGPLRCVICLEHKFPPDYLRETPCGHWVCLYCLRRYVEGRINHLKSLTVTCPVVECSQPLPNSFIEDYASPGAVAKFRARQLDIPLLRAGRLFYCPDCGGDIKLQAKMREAAGATAKVTCDRCRIIICGLCNELDHPSMTCAQNVTCRYGLLARGMEWQLCPTCKAVVREACKCGHMMCKQCLTTFCRFCRKRPGRCPSRPRSPADLPSDLTCCLENTNVSRLATVSRMKASICILVLVWLLVILTSPLIALVILPYIVAQNLAEYWLRKAVRTAKIHEATTTMVYTDNAFEHHASRNKGNTLALNISSNNVSTLSISEPPVLPPLPEHRPTCCIYCKAWLVGIGVFVLAPLSVVAINVAAVVILIANLVDR